MPPRKEERNWLQDSPSGPLLVEIQFCDATLNGGSWILEPWFLGLQAPLQLFTLPLVPGSEQSDLVATDHGEVLVVRRVGEETVVETPYGGLLATPVELELVGDFFFLVEFYFNEYIGPVAYDSEQLVEIDGIVATEWTTWSAIKAFFE